MDSKDKHFSDQPREHYEDVVNVLSQRFGEIVSREVIFDVVGYCRGDLSNSTAAMLSIVGKNEEQTKSDLETFSNQPTVSLKDNTIPQNNPTNSYANMATKTGAIPKAKSDKLPVQKNIQWTPQVKNIIGCHSKGYCIMIIMRGVPGSGKSYLARQIIEATAGPSDMNYKCHIASTDDYFYVNGTYVHNRNNLSEAHEWNQSRVRNLIRQGLSPIIVDNTNVKLWEMDVYAKAAVAAGYIIEIMEPNTSWAFNPSKCFRMCRHNVPLASIRRMLENYENQGVNGENLLKILHINYNSNRLPPVQRKIPPVDETEPPVTQPDTKKTNDVDTIPKADPSSPKLVSFSNVSNKPEEQTHMNAGLTKMAPNTDLVKDMNVKYIEIKKKLEEYDKIDEAWESGEGWSKDETVKNESSMAEPKPPRRRPNSESKPLLSDVDDWRSYTQFLPPWTDNDLPSTSNLISKAQIETCDNTTCIEIGDVEIPNKKYKTITGTPKDINFYYIPAPEKIPDKRMLDKSSMTNDYDMMSVGPRCSNQDKHFKAFRRMFKNISKADLWDIFEKCCGDVNWAVEIVLDGVSSNSIETLEKDVLSDEEEPCHDQCQCAAAYEIIPVVNESVKTDIEVVDDRPILLMPKKVKKEKTTSENSIQLKRQIEKNIVLSDCHYSPHMKMIKSWRNGETPPATPNDQADAEQNSEEKGIEDGASTSTSKPFEREKSDDTSSSNSDTYEEETVNVNFGFDFIKKLDSLFDREGVTYSENISPTICMPLSTLSAINALWMESLTSQLEGQAEYTNVLMKQDEDFARELSAKEVELELNGTEPEIPDFKEIMDMEYAMSVYQKDMNEMRSQEKTTIADVLSRKKLFAMFPDVSQDTLLEMLMAHDNDFKQTVEVLLMSLGRTDVIETEKGLEKFIAEKEMEQHIERLEVEKQKQLDREKDYKMLNKLDEEIDMNTVEQLREKAYLLLQNRDANYNKAQDYISRGMTTAASYYSGLANMQTRRYEMTNHLAANALIQVHSANNDSTTLDLHHLHVGEAIQALDIFLDHHISLLKEDQKKGVYKRITLFMITGRGLHSKNGPKIRPAVRRRLNARGLRPKMLNPGLCSIELCCDNKMTHQLL